MNWEAIGAIGQVLGSAAVFVSLGYLAVQIRRSTAQAKADSFVKMTEMAGNLTVLLAQDLPLARTLLTAGQEWSSVPPEGQWQAHMLNLVEVQLYECWYHMMLQGQLDEATYYSREGHIARRLSSPGMRYWWDHYAYNLDPRFVARINSRLSTPASLPQLANLPFFDVGTWSGVDRDSRG
jgi:hypothetical protein